MNAKEKSMIEPGRPLQRPRRIFSGKDYKELWEAIGKVENEETRFVFQLLGRGCQELELVVRGLENRIAKLEDQ